MKLTFKRYLIKEGGKATAEWDTERAYPKDVKVALEKVSSAIGMSEKDLAKNLLGTSRLTYLGKKSSSGDIDIAINSKNFPDFHKQLLQSVDSRGLYNTGTKVGSYAVDVGGKRVQVDLMFVDDEDIAKFTYYSSEGEDSKYPGAVRNIMLMTLATFILEDGKDFVLKNDEDEIIARASRSLKLGVGLERLFKVAKKRKDGEGRLKSLEKVSPDELEAELKDINSNLIGKFEKSADIISDPDKIAHFFFGEKVFAKDITTAEDVSKQINKTFSGEHLATIKKRIKDQLEEQGFEAPTEL